MDANIEEIWKDVPSFEGIYQASNLGRIRTLYRTINGVLGHVIKTRINERGYERVRIRVNKRTKHHQAHRIIAMAWIPNPENKPQVNHINGIKADNRIENLEWVTRSENIIHSFYVLKNKRIGKLTDTQIVEIRSSKLNDKGNPMHVKHNISIQMVFRIRRRLCYKSVL